MNDAPFPKPPQIGLYRKCPICGMGFPIPTTRWVGLSDSSREKAERWPTLIDEHMAAHVATATI